MNSKTRRSWKERVAKAHEKGYQEGYEEGYLAGRNAEYERMAEELHKARMGVCELAGQNIALRIAQEGA